MLMPTHMTEDQLRQWGRDELLVRDVEIKGGDLDGAIANAHKRRKKAGLTTPQSTWAVHEAQRERHQKS